MTKWFQNPDFWMAHYPRLFTQERMAAAEEEIDAIERLAEIRPPALVLDLCCGPGRHSVALARRGYAVTGVDLTPQYLTLAEERAQAAGVTPEFIISDMRSFRIIDSFDMIINLFTSFGYFEAIEDDHMVLSNVYASLKPGGVFVMDMMGKEILAKCFQSRDWIETDGVLLLEERSVHQDWTWITNRCTFIDADDRKELSLSHRIYSARELKTALMETGFRKVTVYGNFDGAPYDHEAERLVVVARK
jgi:SAM-dependent methyltransferase